MGNLKTNLLVIGLILACLGIGYGWYDSNQKKNNALEMHLKLEAALADSIRTHQNEKGEWVTEKKTLQFDLDRKKELIGVLNEEQKDMVGRIEEANKDKDVFAAALFAANATIDSLLNTEVEIINDSTMVFSDSTEHFQYNISVGNVQPFKDYKPYLSINRFTIPTSYFITFNWLDNRKEGYPVSFDVTPTNPFIRITSAESYTIPQIQKQLVNPTGWKKFGNFFKERWQDIIIGGVGFGLGYGVGASR